MVGFVSDPSVSASCSSSDIDNGSSSRGEQTQSSGTTSTTLGRKETRTLNRSKIIVYASLIFAALTVSISTYFFLRKGETTLFENETESISSQILFGVEEKVEGTLRAIHELSVWITAASTDIHANWPNFTLSHFHLRTQEALESSGSDFLGFAPLLTTLERKVQFESYAQDHQDWIQNSLDDSGQSEVQPGLIPKFIQSANVAEANESEVPAAPLWQIEPTPKQASSLLQDMLSLSWFREAAAHAAICGRAFSNIVDLSFVEDLLQLYEDYDDAPHSLIIDLVYKDFERLDFPQDVEDNIIGYAIADAPWRKFFINLLPEGTSRLIAVVRDTCGSTLSFEVHGRDAKFIAREDVHNSKYDNMVNTYWINAYHRQTNVTDETVHCVYSIDIYPTDELRKAYVTSQPIIFAGVVLMVFFATILAFFLYDCAVQMKQNKIVATAKRTTAIVNSLFPKNVQDRIMQDAKEQAQEEIENGKRSFFTPRNKLKAFVGSHDEDDDNDRVESGQDTAPIADLFPEATIMFADIVGFTAWSSTRQPCEVFTLLETIYNAFDLIAKRRRVFKVETVGDCYVAVAGLPEPQRNHAVMMSRFARDCLFKLHSLLEQLEEKLGPDTTSLGMRVGLHSGPVTAGVLRGEKARFQLFGDTVNTASRIESTGSKNKIHLSKETASLLADAGKGHWTHQRQDKVNAKGKGELDTFWLEIKGGSSRSTTSLSSDDSTNSLSRSRPDIFSTKPPQGNNNEEKTARLVNWCTDLLARQLKAIIARREAAEKPADQDSVLDMLESQLSEEDEGILETVKEVIDLPHFDPEAARRAKRTESISLDERVRMQLLDYIRNIAGLYRENSFHNFEHASHVTMSTVKLLNRIIAPDLEEESAASMNEKTLHDYTYGITSDPLTQFAVVFLAIIHDVDHTGVPNSQLVKEALPLAKFYNNKSVAEQNSVQIAWDLLMDDRYRELRRTIYATREEFFHFRSVVVNGVMATDIMDADLGKARKERWSKAFSENDTLNETREVTNNRKATIVIEHLIQASDVAHTMQHWHVYRKWNERFFHECFKAYQEGRADKDPSENWYKGEIGFYDYYIIPLAKKLKDCGVFGVSSDEYLDYALKNREEWKAKGEAIVAQMVQSWHES